MNDVLRHLTCACAMELTHVSQRIRNAQCTIKLQLPACRGHHSLSARGVKVAAIIFASELKLLKLFKLILVICQVC